MDMDRDISFDDFTMGPYFAKEKGFSKVLFDKDFNRDIS